MFRTRKTQNDLLIDLTADTATPVAGPPSGCSATAMRGHRCGRPVIEGTALCDDHTAMGWSTRDEYAARPVHR